jgi:hypothetical protein
MLTLGFLTAYPSMPYEHFLLLVSANLFLLN